MRVSILRSMKRLLTVCLLCVALGGAAQVHTNAGQTNQNARPTLTNRGIEEARRRNQSRGQAYELQRRELPPASAEETAERAASELRFMQELAAQQAEQRGDAEAAFRAQAQALRFEFAEVNAALNYYRVSLAEATQTSSLTSLATPATTIAGLPPIAYPYNFGGIGYGNRGFGGYVRGGGNLNRLRAPRGASVGIGVNINGGVRGGAIANRGYGRRDVRNVRARRPYPFPAYPYFSGVPFIGYPLVSNDAAQIRDRVRELEAAHAQLVARQRVLEEEARRAGVAPGVLRQ